LNTLVDFIETLVGHTFPSRWYTDTGPTLERELAQRAGLGWIGKNTCLINPHAGSYFLLAEIFMGIELEPDLQFTDDRCGSCARCIRACPTQCILPDRTLDARRCISYLTIELKGAIPLELRPMMNGWIFGCDICQQVCPWNRLAHGNIDRAFAHPLVQSPPDLGQELALTSEEFSRRYRHSPLRRAKRRGYHRNIAVALGNIDTSPATQPLEKLLRTHTEPLVRGHAAWALGNIHSSSTLRVLQRMAAHEKDAYVLREIENALAKYI